MGLIFIEQGKYEEAEQEFRKAYASQPSNINTIQNLTAILQELQKYEEALQFCNEALAIEPTNIDLLLDRSHILIRTKRYEEAIKDCDQVISMDTFNALAYYNKGCAKSLISFKEEALRLIRHAIALDITFMEKAKEDPDLAGLREDINFKKLIE